MCARLWILESAAAAASTQKLYLAAQTRRAWLTSRLQTCCADSKPLNRRAKSHQQLRRAPYALAQATCSRRDLRTRPVPSWWQGSMMRALKFFLSSAVFIAFCAALQLRPSGSLARFVVRGRGLAAASGNVRQSSWPMRGRLARLAMSTTAEGTSAAAEGKKGGGKGPKGDFSVYAVGQQFDADLISAKEFGIFVDIGQGYNVLLPKSKISSSTYDKLKGLIDAKSKDKVKIELFSVDAEKQTLGGKCVDDNFKGSKKERKAHNDVAKYEVGQIVQGSVVSVLDFGAFVSIKDSDVDALVPNSKMKGVVLT